MYEDDDDFRVVLTTYALAIMKVEDNYTSLSKVVVLLLLLCVIIFLLL